MTQGITKKEPDPRIVYADIIDLPHYQSSKRAHMSLYDRAAQFSSYKALSGYEDMVGEEARITDAKVELSDEEIEKLNQKLNLISDVIADGHQPEVCITYFVPDELKSGGKYVTVTDKVRRIDSVKRVIVLNKTTDVSKRNMEISIDDISNISGELVDYLDEVGDY